MKSETLQLTSIVQKIIQKLQQYSTPQSLHSTRFTDQLDVLFLTKKPLTHTFICDTSTSIQIELKTDKSKPVQEYELYPWNRVMTHYYQVTHDHDKYLYTLNCTDATLFDRYGIRGNDTERNESYGGGMFEEAQGQLLENVDKEYQAQAYEPLHYFPRNIFADFLKNRQNLTLPDPLEKIRIYDWSIKVVNISKSNWYALIIEVHKFKFLNEKVWIDELKLEKSTKSNTILLKNIGSIIYDKKIQSILEKMRLADIRWDMMKAQSKQNTKAEDEQISMCYHLRNVQASHKLPKLSQFVTLDTKGEVIKFDPKRPVSFIPIGELEGMCSFPQPVNLNEPQKKDQLRDLNSFSMKGLHEILNKQAVEAKKDKQMREKAERYRNGKEKVGESDWNRMLKERLEASHHRINNDTNKGIEPSTFSDSFEEDNDLWSDSDPHKDREQEMRMENEHENYVTKYSELLNNVVDQEESSQEEEENEYFRKYREEMKKMFEKS